MIVHHSAAEKTWKKQRRKQTLKRNKDNKQTDRKESHSCFGGHEFPLAQKLPLLKKASYDQKSAKY
jgi:hypothetical protein